MSSKACYQVIRINLLIIKFVFSNDVVSGVYKLDRCLVNAYSQQTKEMNGATGIFFLPPFYNIFFITNIFFHTSPRALNFYVPGYACSSHTEPDLTRI